MNSNKNSNKDTHDVYKPNRPHQPITMQGNALCNPEQKTCKIYYFQRQTPTSGDKIKSRKRNGLKKSK